MGGLVGSSDPGWVVRVCGLHCLRPKPPDFEGNSASKLHSHQHHLGLHRRREPIRRASSTATVIALQMSSQASCSSSRDGMLALWTMRGRPEVRDPAALAVVCTQCRRPLFVSSLPGRNPPYAGTHPHHGLFRRKSKFSRE